MWMSEVEKEEVLEEVEKKAEGRGYIAQSCVVTYER